MVTPSRTLARDLTFLPFPAFAPDVVGTNKKNKKVREETIPHVVWYTSYLALCFLLFGILRVCEVNCRNTRKYARQ